MKSQFIQKNPKTHRADRPQSAPYLQLDARTGFSVTVTLHRKNPTTRSAACFEALKARLSGQSKHYMSVAMVTVIASATAVVGFANVNEQPLPNVHLAQSSTILLSFNCVTRESKMLGIPNNSGRDPILNFSVELASDARVFVNGLPFEARYKGFSESGELTFSAISVIHVGVATHGAVSKGMIMPDVSEDEVAAIAEIQSGIYAMMLGGRDRVMAIRVSPEDVVFGDVTEDSAVNQFDVDCD